ncbi:hypothetical protein J6590_018314 [Homalodisca vitripennis]|nr:hypothetical protein J6590_018314 [Homalodisca vitripennis]
MVEAKEIQPPLQRLCHPGQLNNTMLDKKYEPVVDEVTLNGCNPAYAYARFPDGRGSTDSTRHLALREEVQDKDIHSLPEGTTLKLGKRFPWT